jgi:hypothetical protein
VRRKPYESVTQSIECLWAVERNEAYFAALLDYYVLKGWVERVALVLSEKINCLGTGKKAGSHITCSGDDKALQEKGLIL